MHGEHAEVAPVAAYLNVNTTDEVSSFVREDEERSGFHDGQHVRLVGSITDLEEVLNAVCEVNEGRECGNVFQRGRPKCGAAHSAFSR